MASPINSNFLSPVGFHLSIEKIPTVNFFAQEVVLPSLNGGIMEQATPVIDAPIIGDKITFGDLILSFAVDEDLKNYEEIFKWMQGIYHPESLDQYAAFHEAESQRLIGRYNHFNHTMMTSDGSLTILTNNGNANKTIKFVDMFPVSLSPLPFTTKATDIQYLQCRAVFKYTGFSF